MADLDVENAHKTLALVEKAGGSGFAIRADVSVVAEVDDLVGCIVAERGRLDHALNNAGIAQWHFNEAGLRTAEISKETFSRLIEVNVLGTWICMRSEINHMIASGGGTIINTASISGMVGRPGSSAYSTSKHALIGLTKSAALEYARDGIRINCICAGFTDTPFVHSTLAAAGSEKLLSSIPMGRLAQPSEIAEMTIWLMSDAASYITGSALTIDGGFMAG